MFLLESFPINQVPEGDWARVCVSHTGPNPSPAYPQTTLSPCTLLLGSPPPPLLLARPHLTRGRPSSTDLWWTPPDPCWETRIGKNRPLHAGRVRGSAAFSQPATASRTSSELPALESSISSALIGIVEVVAAVVLALERLQAALQEAANSSSR